MAERVERRFPSVEWVPVSAADLSAPDSCSRPSSSRALRAHAERRAAELKLPLVWPDHFPSAGTAALRVAVYAVREGVGAAFALAACRLAFGGGFDLEDPLNLAEAAAAAGIGLEACLYESRNPENDGPLKTAAHRLLAQGVTQLPAFGVGDRWFTGEERLAEVSARARAPIAATHPA